MTTPRLIEPKAIAALAAAVMVLVPSSASAQDPGPVLVVGDSLEVGTEPYLRQELPGVNLTVDALKGRPSSEGVNVLSSALQPQHEIVVFDLGTNDDPGNPDGLAASLQSARSIAGDRCMVVATINRPPLGGVSDDGLNSAISTFAANDHVEVADWRSAASGGGVLQPDGVHGTPSGYALRGQIVADAIRSCASPGVTLGGGGGGSDDADPEPPKPVRSPTFGPGFGLLDDPAAMIFVRIRRLLAFAIAPVHTALRALDSAATIGDRLLEKIGDQPSQP